MKRCPECGNTLPPEEFHLNSATTDGRQAWCRECMLIYRHDVARGRRIPREQVRRFPKLYDQAWLEQQYLRDLLTPREIANIVGCSPASVYIALRRLGISTVPHAVRAHLLARLEAQRQEAQA